MAGETWWGERCYKASTGHVETDRTNARRPDMATRSRARKERWPNEDKRVFHPADVVSASHYLQAPRMRLVQRTPHQGNCKRSAFWRTISPVEQGASIGSNAFSLLSSWALQLDIGQLCSNCTIGLSGSRWTCSKVAVAALQHIDISMKYR